jgi:hypothetical protein
VIITVFPGQGSQTPGFLAPWLELDGARERLEQFSSDAGVDLVAAAPSGMPTASATRRSPSRSSWRRASCPTPR